jgi:hypothetical protein
LITFISDGWLVCEKATAVKKTTNKAVNLNMAPSLRMCGKG